MAGRAVLEALRHVWLTLKSADAPAAVAGGIALAAWKHVRATKDVDLLLGVSRRDADRLLPTLEAAGIGIKSDPPWTSLGRLAVLRLRYEPPGAFVDVEIDLLTGEGDYHRQAVERRIATHLPDLDIEVDVLACEDLILHKLLAGRIIDRADAAALLRANRRGLDLDYLTSWSNKLGLTDGLSEAWNEALPEVPFPPNDRGT